MRPLINENKQQLDKIKKNQNYVILGFIFEKKIYFQRHKSH